MFGQFLKIKSLGFSAAKWAALAAKINHQYCKSFTCQTFQLQVSDTRERGSDQIWTSNSSASEAAIVIPPNVPVIIKIK